jgi:hypothetical protein
MEMGRFEYIAAMSAQWHQMLYQSSFVRENELAFQENKNKQSVRGGERAKKKGGRRK